LRTALQATGSPPSDPMAQLLAVHALFILTAATAAGNAVLTAWAIVAHRRRRSTLGRAFWTLLLLVLMVLAVQIATGAVVAVAGARPKTSLHFLYGVLVTTGAVVQFGLRPGGFLRAAMTRNEASWREPRSLAIVCVTQMLLILRAYMTGAFGH
jgi:hypothetical protein